MFKAILITAAVCIPLGFAFAFFVFRKHPTWLDPFHKWSRKAHEFLDDLEQGL